MTINLSSICLVLMSLIIWLVLYVWSVVLRFGSNLTYTSEIIAGIATLIPVVIGVLVWLGKLSFVW